MDSWESFNIMKDINGGWNGSCTGGNILILHFENGEKWGSDSIDQPVNFVIYMELLTEKVFQHGYLWKTGDM